MSDRPNGPRPGDGGHSGNDCAFVQDLAEGYVLAAVDPAERERIAANLETCAECQTLIARLRQTAALLPFWDVDERPSPAAKSALMARVTGVPPVAAAKPRPPVALLERGERFRPGLAALPMAAALVLSLVWSVSLQQANNQQEDDIERMRQQGLATMLSMPSGPSQWYTLQPICTECGYGAELKADSNPNKVHVRAWALDPSRAHAVMLKGGNGDWQKLGTLDVADNGAAMDMLLLSRPLHTYETLMIMSMPKNGAEADATPELMVEPAADIAPSGVIMLSH